MPPPFVEHPAYYGRHVDYGTHLNTADGLYALNASRNVTGQVTAWPFNAAIWFSSTNLAIVGARWVYENSRVQWTSILRQASHRE